MKFGLLDGGILDGQDCRLLIVDGTEDSVFS